MQNAAVSSLLRRGLVLLLCLGLLAAGAWYVSRSLTDREAAAELPTFTLAGGGDVLIHPELIEQAERDAEGQDGVAVDFGPLLAGLEPVTANVDLALCHLETVIAEDGGPYEGFPDFAVPAEITTALAGIGYDGCSTASNHILDHGPEGVGRTLDALDAAGLGHTGSARSAEEAAELTVYEAGPARVAHLSYSYGFNGREIPEDQPWLTNRIDGERIVEEAAAARAAGADVVVASLHWGQEMQHEPSPAQARLARALAESGQVDLVLGHHAHVVQPMEKIGDTWIAYGLGNQVARHRTPKGTTEEGVLGWFQFVQDADGWRIDRARFVPTLVDLDGPDIRVVNVATALNGHGLAEEKQARYRTAFRRTEGVLLNRGGEADGLRALNPVE